MNVVRRTGAALGVLIAVATAVMMIWPAGARTANAQTEPAVAITSWSWEARDIGSWSAFTVRLRNRTDREFRGEVALVPGPVVPSAVLHHLPVALPARAEAAFTIPVLADNSSYRAEVRDRTGQTIARSGPVSVSPSEKDYVGLLSDFPGGQALLGASARVPFAVSSRFASARDFPTSPLGLRGLRAVVVDDFDSTTLSSEQVRALQEFVRLGGSLVLAGGAAAGRTVLPLPEDLVPLRPGATAVASLAPLADLTAQTTADSAVVTTGEARDGRSVLEGAEGVPLIVERPYGMGRVVQLAFDPIAEIDSKGSSAALARDHALLRAGIDFRRPQPAPDTAAQPEAASEKAARLLHEGASTSWIGVASAALAAYGLVAGPLAFGLRRSWPGGAAFWSRAPIVALVASGVVLGVARGPWHHSFVDQRVPVEDSALHVVHSDQGVGGRIEAEPGSAVSLVPGAEQRMVLPDVLATAGMRFTTASRSRPGLGAEATHLADRARVTIHTRSRWDPRLLLTSSATGLHPAEVPRLICCYEASAVRVYEIPVPPTKGAPVTLVATATSNQPATVEVFDWVSRGWRVVPDAFGPGALIAPDEAQGGTIRVRARGAGVGTTELRLA